MSRYHGEGCIYYSFFTKKNNDFEFMYADFGTLTNISVYFVTVMKIPMACTCNLIFLFRVSVTQSLSFLVLVLLSLVRLHMMFISFWLGYYLVYLEIKN